MHQQPKRSAPDGGSAPLGEARRPTRPRREAIGRASAQAALAAAAVVASQLAPAATGAIAIVAAVSVGLVGLIGLVGLRAEAAGTRADAAVAGAGVTGSASAAPLPVDAAADRATPMSAPAEDESHARLLREVLPVWQRQLDAARVLAERTTEDTLSAFGGIADGIERAIGGGAQTPGGAGLVALRADIDRALVGFQAQDRMNQMLTTVVADIGRMSEQLSPEGVRVATGAAKWLERLDASYTMQEQRSLHQDQPVSPRATGVEYF